MISFHKALDLIMELPPDDRENLIEIVKKRRIEERREEIAIETQETLELYKAGKLVPLTADEAIKELESLLEDDTEQ